MTPGRLKVPDATHSLDYRVYLPPCYARSPSAHFPTLYLLHGLTSTESQWDELGIDETADTMIASGLLPPFVIVMPREMMGDDLEAALVDELVPEVEREYRTGGSRALRAVGGLSRGGGWALRIGLKHPGLFSAVGLHSPAPIAPDLYSLQTWVKAVPAGEMPRMWIDVGWDDTHRPDVEGLAGLLDNLQVPYAWHVLPGEHAASYWMANLGTYLAWYATAW